MISKTTYDKIIELLTATFQMNSFCDNIAYNLGFIKLIQCEDIFHHKFAHKFPELADIISDLILKLSNRPIRGPLSQDIRSYEDIADMFNDVYDKVIEYRKLIIEVIESAEYNDDYEIKIALEEFLNSFLIYIDQSYTWKVKANQYKDDAKSFDNHFEDFTKI